jgi:hypothetical protein
MRTKFSAKEHRDAGLALMLLMLLVRVMGKVHVADALLVFVLLLTMVAPALLYPFSWLWYNISDVLGRMASLLLLNLVYWLLLVPVAVVRKMMGRDSLKLRQFKKSKDSVFHQRNYTFTSQDLSNTF